jgi:uncharacterized protein
MNADLDAMWSAGLSNGELAFPRCSACGAWNWYPLPQCGRCQSSQTPWVRVALQGRIFSWTRTHHDFVKGGVLAEPVVIALVEIADAPEIRIPCRQQTAGAPPAIGEPVNLVVGHFEDRTIWCFAPHSERADTAADKGAP